MLSFGDSRILFVNKGRDSMLMSILDIIEERWISHQIIESVRNSPLYVINSQKETSKVLWYDEKKKKILVYTMSIDGSLVHFTTLNISGTMIAVFDNNLKKNDGKFILIKESISSLAPINAK